MTFSGGKAASEEMHMITDYLRKNSRSAWFSGMIAMGNERLASIVHADECIAIGGRQRRAVIQVFNLVDRRMLNSQKPNCRVQVGPCPCPCLLLAVSVGSGNG